MDVEPLSLGSEWMPRGGPHAFRSRDGRRLLDLQIRPQGIRDLHATLLKMALEAARQPRGARGIIAAWMPRATNERIAREWEEAVGLLKPAVADRMALLVVRPDRVLALPEGRELRRWGEAIRDRLARLEVPVRESKPAPSRSFFEVFKVLLRRWLLKKGPVAVGELMRWTGTSYPTVAEALRRLEATGELARRSNRSVELPRFPGRTWPEILALSGSLRRTRTYADESGRGDPMDLHRRLRGMTAGPVALGGVQAARHWDPEFDLHGLPRLDVVVHTTPTMGELGFIGRLDPALRKVEPNAGGIVLAVHPIVRAEAGFEPNPKGGIPWADPVETLLDLHELRLADQADAMIRRLSR